MIESIIIKIKNTNNKITDNSIIINTLNTPVVEILKIFDQILANKDYITRLNLNNNPTEHIEKLGPLHETYLINKNIELKIGKKFLHQITRKTLIKANIMLVLQHENMYDYKETIFIQLMNKEIINFSDFITLLNMNETRVKERWSSDEGFEIISLSNNEMNNIEFKRYYNKDTFNTMQLVIKNIDN